MTKKFITQLAYNKKNNYNDIIRYFTILKNTIYRNVLYIFLKLITIIKYLLCDIMLSDRMTTF